MITKLLNLFWRLTLINYIYQLTSPGKFNLKFEKLDVRNKVIVRPTFMSICHADQRYYRGKRPLNILRKKLPMALIHECCGFVLKDYSGTFSQGAHVVLIPNILSENPQDKIFENYQKGAKFRSSGVDGFMQELVSMDADRLVEFNDFYGNEYIFSITELVSVSFHSVKRFLNNSHKTRKRIAVFGDGNVGFLTSLVISHLLPNAEILIFGHHEEKLAHFCFVSNTFAEIPETIEFDHAFDCTGGNGCANAIDQIIDHINPQGTIILMGVSDEKVPINTRNVLEKGLTIIGCSRSGFEDFVDSVKFLENERFNNVVSTLISSIEEVNSVADIHKMFEKVLNVPFKLVFKWNL